MSRATLRRIFFVCETVLIVLMVLPMVLPLRMLNMMPSLIDTLLWGFAVSVLPLVSLALWRTDPKLTAVGILSFASVVALTITGHRWIQAGMP